jgi:hypothetical protein
MLKRLIPVLVTLAVLAVATSSASAAEPWWSLAMTTVPSMLPRGGEGTVLLTADNVGNGAANACTEVPEGTGVYSTNGCEAEGASPSERRFVKTPLVATATLPEGVEVVKVKPEGTLVPQVSFYPSSSETEMGALEEKRFQGRAGLGPEEVFGFVHACGEPAPRVVSCALENNLGYGETHEIIPYGFVQFAVRVRVKPGAKSGEVAREMLSGATAPSAQSQRPLLVGEPGETAPFGVEQNGLEFVPEAEGGQPDTQAGSHPYQLTTTFSLNQTSDPLKPPALPKDLKFSLPPGLVANVVAFPRCSELQFLTKTTISDGWGDECPQDTAVGVILLTVDAPGLPGGVSTRPVPVFNLVPNKGEPVRFGFFLAGIAVTIDFHVRTGADYSAYAEVRNITQISNFQTQSLTIWGVPGEASHDSARGYECLAGGLYGSQKCAPLNESRPVPFLTMPTSCQEPWRASVEGDSWPLRPDPETEPPFAARSIPLGEANSTYALKDEFERPLGLTGCEELSFDPSIEVAPDVSNASSASGLKVAVKVPQEVNENARGLASSSVRDITVAFPAGVQVNPSGGNGLEACTSSLSATSGTPGNEIGYTGKHPFASVPGTELLTFTPRLPGSVDALENGEEGELKGGVNFCPDASKIGTVKIKVPIIAHPIEGALYLAAQNENPFGSLIASYIVAEDPETGVLVKLAGSVLLDPATGQVTTTFENSPQDPLEEAEIHLYGGEQAPFATPAHCGTYETTATFTPWSDEIEHEEAEHKEPKSVRATSTFQIDRGPKTASEPNGSPCPGSSLPFAPSLTGGSTNINAGSFSPLTTTIGREDGQQNMSQVTLRFPPGLSGLLSGVKLCGEQQANEGKCGPESEIGETTVSAGVGNDPVAVKGGKVYITEKYHGAPFGLSIVNPVKAGPYDLEHDTSNPNQDPACDCIVVRAKIEVNPITAALTVTTNNENEGYAGAGGIPHIIDGIPVQIKKVNVIVNREHFSFNPTNCNSMKIEGSIASDEGASSPVSVPFQVTNCAALKFTPKFAVSTNGKTSKANGASLTAKVTEPSEPQGSQANIAKVKVELPLQLPSRLTTLQKACTAAQFEANPAGCPPASFIGHAVVHTPLLPVPLEGPAIFVSHGNEAFPSLTMVLQGYGVTIDLVGTTFISKSGITSTTFKTVPDQPFSAFELTLSEGKYSALAANGNLCKPTVTETVRKKVKVKVKGRTKTVTRKVKETVSSSLVMPNEFIAQNGAAIKRNTTISVTGCPRARKARAKAKKKTHNEHRRRRDTAKAGPRRMAEITNEAAGGWVR